MVAQCHFHFELVTNTKPNLSTSFPSLLVRNLKITHLVIVDVWLFAPLDPLLEIFDLINFLF